MKVYPDNDVFSAMMAKSKPDMTEIENAAILRIRSAEMRGELVLVTSEVHKREIDKVPEQHRAPYQSAFGALPQIEFVEDRTLLGFNTILRAGVVVYPLFEYEAIVRVLWDLGVKQLDAHHLMVANCDVFLTCDGGILARRDAIQRKFPIRIAKPSEFAP